VLVWQDAELAYQLWKARQVADQQGSSAVAVVVAVVGEGGEEAWQKEARGEGLTRGLTVAVVVGGCRFKRHGCG
jgi:hypothetical protein